MKIAVIDPSLFTLPYDIHLCQGLAQHAEQVFLYGRPLRKTEKEVPKEIAFIPWFYHISEKVVLQGRGGSLCKKVIKAVEHLVGTISLTHHLISQKPDVVHYQWLPVPLFDAWMIKKLKKNHIPVLFTVHDTKPFNASPTSKGQLIGWEKLLYVFDKLIVHTQKSKNDLIAIGIPPEKIAIVPHGLLSFGKISEHKEPKDKNILFLGTIKPYKGIETLIEAFSKIQDKDCTLKIIGSCREENLIASYKKISQDLRVQDRITFDIRFVRDEEIPLFLNEATIVAFPYYEIDASGAFLTALIYEKPFVATDIGIFHELLSEYPETLVKPKDAIGLTKALDNALENVPLFKKIAQTVKKTIPTWESIGKQTTQIYEEIISE